MNSNKLLNSSSTTYFLSESSKRKSWDINDEQNNIQWKEESREYSKLEIK